MKEDYDFKEIETKWQHHWEEVRAFEVSEDPEKKKFYCLEMFPYPSGRIHMGHVRNYTIGDVISRFKMMKGFNVLHPIGWDALGMPAENAAISHGIHPQKWTLENIGYMKSQLKRLGLSYDWSREVNTCLPDYYRWNQWIFLKMFEKGLAFRKKSWVNWCPECRTVLANEQAQGGRCWRCDSEVEQKGMEQWFLKITDYAEELLSGHDRLEKWPDHVLLMQKNWIGKSRGALVAFPVVGTSSAIDIFTTRIDTIYGATFLVLSPEHPLSLELIQDMKEKEELETWIERAILDSHLKRENVAEGREGRDTGKKAINPFTGEHIPIWIANYVLMEYGTGAIMAVPAHDQRDFEFARKYSLPMREVIVPENPLRERDAAERAFEDYGILVNSGLFSGLRSEEAMDKMAQYASEKGFGAATTIFRLRDWGISRQRYWGTPIPVIYCQNCGIVGIPYEDLPVVLPFDVELTGEEGSPLKKVENFVRTTCPKCRGPAQRETDTMDTFFDSSWYFFRYTSPQEEVLPFDPERAAYWLPVDLYIGGVEHAILHLVYARFFTKVLRDIGLTKISEPFPHLLAQGMVTKDGAAMSKSRGNVVDPDEMIEKYGADSLRLFILFAAPPEKEFAWNDEGIEGCHRFLNRLWSFFGECRSLFEEIAPESREISSLNPSSQRLIKKMHQTIKKVGEDIERRFHLNTAISALMEFFNQIKKEKELLEKESQGKVLLKKALETLLLLLSPFAPHLAEELWQRMGQRTLLVHSSWPDYDENLAKEETVTIVVQVNGKLRDSFEAPLHLSEEEAKEKAFQLPRIQRLVEDKKIKKIIYVSDKLINIVI